MTKANRIEGVLRLSTPLHCASPDKSYLLGDRANDNETPTVVQYVVTSTGKSLIPYFPGNDLRGRLRRKAAKLVLDHISAVEKVSPQLYVGLNAGTISGQPDKADLTVEEAVRAHRNVYMGVFGGGARLLRSRYQVADLVPILQSTIDMGWVAPAFGESSDQTFTPTQVDKAGDKKPVEGWQLIQLTQVLRVDDLMRVLRPDELERYVKNATEVVAELQASTQAAKLERKASKAQAAAGDIRASDVAKRVDVGTIASFQSIVAGTPMYFRLDFSDDVTNAHVGLILLALRELVAEQKLGGWCRAGLGRFTAALTLTRDGETFPIFSESCASDAATLSPQVQHMADAATDEISRLTERDMLAFFENRPGAKDNRKEPEAA